MTRLASKPVWGPAVSSSEPALLAFAAFAASALAPELSPTSVDDAGPGLGLLLEHPALVNAAGTLNIIITFRIYLTLAALSIWKNRPAAIFRTSAPLPPSKSVVFAGCSTP